MMNKSFMMTLNKKTHDFLCGWYQLPIQDVLRTLAATEKKSLELRAKNPFLGTEAVDKATKETQKQ